jgi:hypothetical protein
VATKNTNKGGGNPNRNYYHGRKSNQDSRDNPESRDNRDTRDNRDKDNRDPKDNHRDKNKDTAGGNEQGGSCRK